MLATYVFWIHHEEKEGEWNFEGQRNLREFLTVCREEQMPVFLRIGPWAHGECRNGGIPDWPEKLMVRIYHAKSVTEVYYEVPPSGETGIVRASLELELEYGRLHIKIRKPIKLIGKSEGNYLRNIILSQILYVNHEITVVKYRKNTDKRIAKPIFIRIAQGNK